MRFKLIGCKIVQRELASIIGRSNNIIDFTLMRQDYHQTPEVLKGILQEEIDSIDNNTSKYTNDLKLNDIDAILLGYGLCSNAVVGLKSRKYKLVIPRAHDCTTLIMGSKEKYKEYFEKSSGTYFYSRGWLELGINEEEQRIEKLRKEYMEKFDDEDTVEYLISMEEGMLKNYDCAAYVKWKDSPAQLEDVVKEIAQSKDWRYEDIEGNDSILADLINGNWDNERFLVVEPGYEVAASCDDMIIKANKIETE